MKTLMVIGAVATAILILGASAIDKESTSPLRSEDLDPCALQTKVAEYQGAKACKKCHFTQHMSWKKTKMAKTYDMLKAGEAADLKKKHKLDPKKDYTQDATCLECHTTGYGKPGGFPKLVEGKEWTKAEKERAEMMEGVQCESCHGPGSLTSPYKKENEEYKKKDLVPLGLVEPDAANCKTCHSEKSPTISKPYKFDYKALVKDKKKVHKHKKMKHTH